MEDRKLIGALVKREVERTMRYQALADAIDMSRNTVYRVRDGSEQTEWPTLLKIERHLRFPYGTFAAVASHDFTELRAMGTDERLVKWLEEEAEREVGYTAGVLDRAQEGAAEEYERRAGTSGEGDRHASLNQDDGKALG